jgi:hypothetical protein
VRTIDHQPSTASTASPAAANPSLAQRAGSENKVEGSTL